MDTKSPLASKTLWFNLAGGIVLAVAQWMGQIDTFAPYAAAALAVGNFLLRFSTKQPVV